jgi:hypothetical protein
VSDLRPTCCPPVPEAFGSRIDCPVWPRGGVLWRDRTRKEKVRPRRSHARGKEANLRAALDGDRRRLADRPSLKLSLVFAPSRRAVFDGFWVLKPYAPALADICGSGEACRGSTTGCSPPVHTTTSGSAGSWAGARGRCSRSARACSMSVTSSRRVRCRSSLSGATRCTIARVSASWLNT